MKSDIRNSLIALLSILLCLHLLSGGSNAWASYSYFSNVQLTNALPGAEHHFLTDTSCDKLALIPETDALDGDCNQSSSENPDDSEGKSPCEDSTEDNEKKEILDDTYLYPDRVLVMPSFSVVEQTAPVLHPINPESRVSDILIPPPKC